jgi:hypothetical protein
MAMIPAMMTGIMHLISRSGRSTPMAEMPTPDLDVPYEAPRPVRRRAQLGLARVAHAATYR